MLDKLQIDRYVDNLFWELYVPLQWEKTRVKTMENCLYYIFYIISIFIYNLG